MERYWMIKLTRPVEAVPQPDIFMQAKPVRVERTRRSPVPTWVKFLFISAVAFFAACKDDPEEPGNDIAVTTVLPELWAADVAGGTVEIALLKGSCNKRTSAYVECGFFLSTNSINTGNLVSAAEGVENCVAEGKDDGTFSYKKSNLTLGVKYCFVAYLKLASGLYTFGEVKEFYPDNICFVPAAKPTATVTGFSYNLATLTIIPGNFGGDCLEDPSILKIYEMGVYYWEDGKSSLATAPKILVEDEMDGIKAGDPVFLDLTPLQGGTKYNFVPFAVMGVFRVTNATSTRPEVQGDQGSFTTASVPLGEVITGNATSITRTRATVSGQVIENADDANPEAGFYCAASTDELNQRLPAGKFTATSIDAGGTFIHVIEGLTGDRMYYYQSYLIANGQTVYGEVKEFRTRESGDPEFARVDATLTNWAGKYLIVYEAQAKGSNTGDYRGATVLAFKSSLTPSTTPVLDGQGNVFVLSPSTPGNAEDLATITNGSVVCTETEVKVTGGQIAWTAELDAIAVTIAEVADGWSIQTASSYFLGGATAAGGLGANLLFSAPNHEHAISIDDDYSTANANDNITFRGCAIIKSKTGSGHNTMRCNANTGRFGYWIPNGQHHPVALYKLE